MKYYLLIFILVISGCNTIPDKTNKSYVVTGFKNGYAQVKNVLIKPDSVTELEWQIGLLIKRRITKKNQCLIQSKVYAWLLGGNAKVMSNGHHAFVVKDGKIYDSTHMDLTGYSIDNEYVKEYYGDVSTWKIRK